MCFLLAQFKQRLKYRRKSLPQFASGTTLNQKRNSCRQGNYLSQCGVNVGEHLEHKTWKTRNPLYSHESWMLITNVSAPYFMID